MVIFEASEERIELASEYHSAELIKEHNGMMMGLDYIAETDKTASGVFRCDHIGREELLPLLRSVAYLAHEMDKYKKAMFRKRTRVEASLAISAFGGDDALPPDAGAPLQIPEEFADLFHGVIGNITEVGEQAEILIKYFETGRVDKIHVFEEIGDNLWYLSRLIKFCGTSFLQVMRANIAKLRARHGEAFSKDRDGKRNLKTEHKALRKGLL